METFKAFNSIEIRDIAYDSHVMQLHRIPHQGNRFPSSQGPITFDFPIIVN